MAVPFDLIEYQQMAREMTKTKDLFDLWNTCCQKKDRGEIGQYELDEMKDVIFPLMESLSTLMATIDSK